MFYSHQYLPKHFYNEICQHFFFEIKTVQTFFLMGNKRAKHTESSFRKDAFTYNKQRYNYLYFHSQFDAKPILELFLIFVLILNTELEML